MGHGVILINKLKCSNNCVFCRLDTNLPDDLSDASVKSLENDISLLYNTGITDLDVSGTDPLRYSNIISFLSLARRSFKKITILSPGNMLEDEAFTKQLVNTDFDSIVIPIYGSNGDVHDLCVGNIGAFSKVVRGLHNLIKYKKINQSIRITSVFLRQNKDDFANLIKFINREFGVNGITINLPKATEDLFSLESFNKINVSFTDITTIILKLSEIPNMAYRITYLPLCIFTSDELKNVYQKKCFTFLNISYKNIHPESKTNVEYLAKINMHRRQVYHSKCSKCFLYGRLCEGILKIHYELNKDYDFQPLSEATYNEIKRMLVH